MAEWIIEVKDGKFPIGKWTELVRCKDCVYYTPEVDEPHKSTCQRLWGGMTECKADSYCSDGVRKDEVLTYTINAGEV